MQTTLHAITMLCVLALGPLACDDANLDPDAVNDIEDAAPRPTPDGVSSGERVAAASGPATTAVGPRDESLDFRFPAADLMRVPDTGTYVAYGASIPGNKLPYTTLEFVDGTFQRRGEIDGNAWTAVKFPAGYWADKGSTLWTPSVFAHREDGQVVYYLFYSAKLVDSDKRCIGFATSLDWSAGWSADADPLFCPDGDRWAIDADVSRGQDDVWLTLRNGAWTKDRVTALGASRLDFDGPRHVRLHRSPTKLLDNATLEWTHHNSPDDDVLTIENPNAVWMNGEWYLFYSGNNWYANRYAIGVAHCGTELVDNPCAPMYEQRAFFSYEPDPDGELRFRPGLPDKYRKKNLPGNKRGPGAFDVIKAPDGSWWVTWNYIIDDSEPDDPVRQSRLARLTRTGSGTAADFTVTW